MAKRSSKKKNKGNKPNIPSETLEQVKAKQPAASEASDDTPASEDAPSQADAVAVQAAAEREAARAKRQVMKRTGGEAAKRGELTATMVAELLENPTREVSEQELRTQYNYVLRDLNSMGLLAAILVIVLLALGFLL